MSVHGLILAGGQGSRLGGVRKGSLRIGNQQLLHRLAENLSKGCDSLLIATGPGAAMPRDRLVTISDIADTHCGPMAGIMAAAQHLLTREASADLILISAAVDTPFLPPDYVQRLLKPLHEGAKAAFSAWADDYFPTNAAWRVAALMTLVPQPSSPKMALAALNAVRVNWSATAARNPFSNVNELADLLALSRRALEGE